MIQKISIQYYRTRTHGSTALELADPEECKEHDFSNTNSEQKDGNAV